MEELYTVAVWLVVAAHFAFLIYLPIGGFLALRWRRTIWLHALAVSWGIASVTLSFWCPLTVLEQWARPRAGMPALGSAGFIDHYVTGVFYPAGATVFVQGAVLVAVLASWVVFARSGSRGGVLGHAVAGFGTGRKIP